MTRKNQVIAVFFILSAAAATKLNLKLGTRRGVTKNQIASFSQEVLNSELDQAKLALRSDESYNPFSDEFQFHSLYENLPNTNYQSLADDLATFVPNENQDYFKIPILTDKLIDSLINKNASQSQFASLISQANIFKKLELYENFTDSTPVSNYPLIKNPNYCDEVDVLNLIYPSNLYRYYNVLDTYFRKSVKTMLKKVSDATYLSKAISDPQVLKPNISLMFGTDGNYDVLRAVGLNFNCKSNFATFLKSNVYDQQRLLPNIKWLNTLSNIFLLQKTNVLVSKGNISRERFPRHVSTTINSSQRLIDSQSEEYALAKVITPIQYLLKVGANTHQGKGVEVLSDELEKQLLANYSSGSFCGIRKDNLIAQKYVSNPLLIYNKQKFDFRIYVLVASTNPLIAFYRDGFVRVSLREYDSKTSDKQSHLTNSHLSDDLVAQAKTEEEKQKLLEMQLSTFQMLADDLESKGRLYGEEEKQEFIDNLRQRFKTAISHILSMTQSAFEKRSGNYRLMGFDFMLDEDMNLWFIEANNSPQMTQTETHRRYFTEILIRDALEIEFALLGSRVKRIRGFVEKAAEDYRIKQEGWDKQALKSIFKEINQEKFEPEFKISSTNTWEKIIDLSLGGSEESGYLGNLDRSCF